MKFKIGDNIVRDSELLHYFSTGKIVGFSDSGACYDICWDDNGNYKTYSTLHPPEFIDVNFKLHLRQSRDMILKDILGEV